MIPFNKIKASTKLYLLVLVVSIFIIGIGLYGIYEIKKMNQDTQTLYADRVSPMEQLETILFSYSVDILSSAHQVQTHQCTYNEALKIIEKSNERISINWKTYMLTYLTPEEGQLAKQTSVLINKSNETIEKLTLILRNQDEQALDSLIKDELYPAINPVIANINKLIHLQVNVSRGIYINNTDAYNTATERFYILIALSLSFICAISIYIIRNVNDLIKRIRASNTKLTESERKYRNIFENVQDVFYQTSLEGITLDVSPSVKNHLGFTSEELIGTHVANLYYSLADREKALAILQEKGALKDHEMRFKSKDGELVHISLNAILIHDADGNPSHLDGSYKDITVHKRMEDQLIEHKAQLALFIEHSPVSLAMFDNEMRYIATSRRWINDYNLEGQQLEGKTYYEIFPDTSEYWKVIHQRCLTGAIEKKEEDIFTLADGSKEWLRWEIHPWYKANNEIGGIIMFTEVITARKQATELFKYQFENSPDIILIINKDFKIETINHGLPEGPPVEELIGVDSVEILPEESRESVREAILTCFATGQNQEMENALRFGHWSRSRFVPIMSQGSISHIMIISTDITQRRIAERERDKMIADIIQRNKKFEQFAFIISHNLRAPVANILGIGDVLKFSLSEEERIKTQELLFKQIQHFDEIVKDLNYVLQIRNEIIENKEPVYLSELVSNITSGIQNVIRSQRVKIITDFSAVDEILTLRSYLHSIFHNLISNAIKFGRPDTEMVIEIKSEISNERIKISFKDNGRGIDLKRHGESIFGLYKRFHLNIEGKGLGLFIVKTQVEVLGGNIQVKSQPDVGAEFIVEFPV